MKFMVSSFFESLGVMKKDKIIVMFSLVPILIGGFLYYFLGQFIFTDFLDWINTWVGTKISSEGAGKIIGWLLTATLSVVMYFIVSWTFVLIVSLIASPFNDVISNRTEKILNGETPESLDKSFGRILKRFGFTVVNELKKISFIVLMTGIALLLNFIPILTPVSFILSAILFGVGFADYSWSRKDLPFRSCLSDVRKNVLGYTFSGAIFIGLIAIPIINLIVLPYSVVYYTVFYVKNNMAGIDV